MHPPRSNGCMPLKIPLGTERQQRDYVTSWRMEHLNKIKAPQFTGTTALAQGYAEWYKTISERIAAADGLPMSIPGEENEE
jgi:hypothetical protein